MTRGRPSKLGSRITIPAVYGPDNALLEPERQTTVGERICELMAATGTRATLCAEAVNCDRKSIATWLSAGSRAEQKQSRGHLLTPPEQRYLDFLLATRASHARWIHDKLALHDQVASGGLVLGKIIEKVDPTRLDESGRPLVLERRVEQARTLPDAAALRWELERLALGEDGERIFAPRLEVTGADGGPIEVESQDERADRMAAELTAYQQGLADQRAREAELGQGGS